MKILVYEHVSGGGYAEKSIPSSVLSEGFGMLRIVVADFKAAGHEVTVLLDERLSKLNPPIDVQCTVPIHYQGETEKFLSVIAKINDATYIIAPETGQTLQRLVELAEKSGKTSLNCEFKAIKLVADKAVLYEELRKNGFLTPKTLVLKIGDSVAQIKKSFKTELNYPIVVKPADGVGCGGLSIVKEETQLQKALGKVKAETKNPCFIAQQFIEGESVSVSLLSTGKKARALSLNKQNIVFAGSDATSSYQGGIVPFDHHLKKRAFEVAEKIVESIPGLKGYVGVDFMLTKLEAYVVDVNPRLTTSYVGLSRVANFNVAEGIVNTVAKGKLPAQQENRGTACFSKIEMPVPTIGVFKKTADLDGVVSPPFPLKDNIQTSALVIGEGATAEEALLRLEEAKKNLLTILS